MNGIGNAERRTVLVVDDEPGMRTALEANFVRHGWSVKTASGVREAAVAAERGSFDLVVTDVRMRDGDGFEVIGLVRQHLPGAAVIVLTAFGNVPEAVRSMRDGALDYLTKPVSFDQLQAVAERVMAKGQGPGSRAQGSEGGDGSVEAHVPKGEGPFGFAQGRLRAPVGFCAALGNAGIVGRAPALLQALQRARAAASTGADVLVEAESGTGKELMARFIHENSDRAGKAFVAVNCAAIPEHLIESELFGHAKGAFTGATMAKAGKFELADGGTILLDEIGEMPLNLQPKLLRVLQEREFERLGEARSQKVDIRVIATTNRSLSAMVEEGSFRSDLYYRLNVIPLSIPALRERSEDIPLLARFFAERFAKDAGCAMPVMDEAFLELLQTHSWPGNVRELGNFMRRVLSLHRDVVIDAGCFELEFRPVMRAQSMGRVLQMSAAGTRISEIEKQHLERTLALAGGNRTHAAEMLGISLRTVRNKIREYGLPPRSYAS